MANGEKFQRWMFIDFVYAIVLGSALPLIGSDHLTVSDPVFYGTLFLVAVILEDYYLYATQIAPFQMGRIYKSSLIFEIAILISWYLAAVAIPKHPRWFLHAVAAFFLLKFLAGLTHWWNFHNSIRKALTDWRCWRNFAFIVPILTSLGFAWCLHPICVSAWMVFWVSISSLVTFFTWWGLTTWHERKQKPVIGDPPRS